MSEEKERLDLIKSHLKTVGFIMLVGFFALLFIYYIGVLLILLVK